MLTRAQLQDLYRDLNDVGVLSVYIDADQIDPADRRAWRVALERGLDEEQRRLEAEAPEAVSPFGTARGLVEAELETHRAFLPGRGWVAFATADELRHLEGVTVPMPNLVRWERGIRVAPYVRALKQDRIVVAVLADRRKARIFTYRDGEVSEHADFVADLDHGDLSESAASKFVGTPTGQTGARGVTGTDAGQRLLDVSAARMQARVVDAADELAGREGYLVLGGTTEVVSALAKLSQHLGDRRLERASMHLGMSTPEVKAEMEEAASELTRRRQSVLLDQVVDAARSGRRGCLGVQATKEALREGRVDILLITRQLRESEGDLADHFVGAAFDRGAAVEELSGSGAARLHEEGEGVGARLRYTT